MNESLTWFTWWHDADLVVRGVFVLLIFFSVVTWWLIFYKLIQLIRAERAGQAALRTLANGKKLSDLAKSLTSGTPTYFLALEASSQDKGGTLDSRMNQVLREQRINLESGLTLLATIGNASPFIGLLGTVWGIMHALQSLDSNSAVSLDVVAGPVAEALVATAAGLFAAIPAVVGYNLLLRFLRRVTCTIEGNAVRILALTKEI
ncbi:MAG: MotA/TolQ/ExbB proton channel family protein [Rhodospirillaceae bacterium]|nr:MotA/TolQ/ExbB proton channel family protein [Rhodospirillaceae bacterium]